MKLDFQLPGALVFAVVFATVGWLVHTGKVPYEALATLLAWLIPSPMQRKLKGGE